MSWITATNKGAVLRVHGVPRSSMTAVQGLHGDAIKIRLQAPPVEGKANGALIRFLSQVLGIAPRRIVMLSGLSGRRKRVLIMGMTVSAIQARLHV